MSWSGAEDRRGDGTASERSGARQQVEGSSGVRGRSHASGEEEERGGRIEGQGYGGQASGGGKRGGRVRSQDRWR